MKKLVFLIVFFLSAGDRLTAQMLGINTSQPTHPVEIVNPPGITLLDNQPLVSIRYNSDHADDVLGLRVSCRPYEGYGIGGYFWGGSIGAKGESYCSFYSTNSTFTGMSARAFGLSVYSQFYGLKAEASGAGYNVALYGTAFDGSNNFAGYFDEGKVYIKNNLGVGEDSPVAAIDILKSQAHVRLTSSTASNGSVLELRNDATNPAYIGAINFNVAESSTPGQIGYKGDNTFHIRVNNADRLRISAAGLVGLSRTALTNRLEVEGNASKSSAGDWLANSDERLKKNIQPLDPSRMIEKILALKGITYEWNDDKTGSVRPEGVHYGFSAQNIQEVFPTLVEEDAKGYLQTAYGTYDAMMVEAIRYLHTENQMLKSELKEIKEMLAQVASR